jgi:hypothetical protein
MKTDKEIAVEYFEHNVSTLMDLQNRLPVEKATEMAMIIDTLYDLTKMIIRRENSQEVSDFLINHYKSKVNKIVNNF